MGGAGAALARAPLPTRPHCAPLPPFRFSHLLKGRRPLALHPCLKSEALPLPSLRSPPLPPAHTLPGAGANWVDPPKRERKRVASYAENEFYRMALQKREYGPRNTGPKLPKMPALQARRRAGGMGRQGCSSWGRAWGAVDDQRERLAGCWAFLIGSRPTPVLYRPMCTAGLPVLQRRPPHRAVREGQHI